MNAVVSILVSAWNLAARMAPYLLFGFAVAGLLHVWLPAAWVLRHLGGRGWVSSVKAALLGVPLPLCSCGVIPVAASIRSQGAGRGATAAFLMSTPQVGVHSVLVTYGILGPAFALLRPVVAFASGALCGIAVDRWTSGGAAPVPVPAASAGSADAWWRRAIRHGFGVLPADIGRELLIGILIAGAVDAWVPPGYLSRVLPAGVAGMAIMIAVSVPVYVCSTASVPIAMAMIQAGVAPSAALAFLVTGPATNAAAVAALGRLLGSRAASVYLASLVATALAAGLFVDRWLIPAFPEMAPSCHVDAASGWSHAAAVALIGVLVGAWIRKRRRAAAARAA